METRHARLCIARGTMDVKSSAKEDLVWSKAEDGRLGVFAGSAIAAGETVERCYSLPVKPSQFDGWTIQPWLYDCGNGGNAPLLFPLGWGLLYNEVPASGGKEQNLAWDCEESFDSAGKLRLFIVFRAIHQVAASEELCVARKRGRRGVLRDMLGTILKVLKAWHGIKLCAKPDCPAEALIRESAIRYPSVYDVQVRSSPLHGSGVFACRPFKKGELVEVTPSLLILNREFEFDGLCTILNDYWAAVEDHDELSQIDLGFGAIYNHSDEPNLERKMARTFRSCRCQKFSTGFFAIRDIDEGEELCHCYGKGYWAVRLAPGERIGSNLSWESDDDGSSISSRGGQDNDDGSSREGQDNDDDTTTSCSDETSLSK